MEKLGRVWEVDALRGIAVVLMVVYHFFFDLNFLGVATVILGSPAFILLQRTVAVLFITIAGITLALSNPTFEKAKYRAFQLAVIACLITVATMVYPGKGAIVFGIIHFLAVSIILGYFLLPLGKKNYFVAAAVFCLWLLVRGLPISSPSLIWAGFPPAGFYSLDYFPLLPWFALIPFGIAIGKSVFSKARRANPPAQLSQICFLGRHALAIYIVHQPVIIGSIMLMSGQLHP